MARDLDRDEEKRACVTGASGYIASWIVKLLLHRGYVVHATVRSLNDPKKTEHLRGLDGAKEKLHLFKANLLEEGSFDSAVDGCCGVFHTASPVLIETPNPQTDLVDPAVKGTLNVLSSCAKAPSVKRVIFTSSAATVFHTGRPITSETLFDETWFSTPEACKGFIGVCMFAKNSTFIPKWPRAFSHSQDSYVLSKTLAEIAAWKFCEENGIDMITINPVVVIGPMLQPVINWSSDLLFNLVNGKSETYLNATFGWVHVKDVAEAHIKAFEIPSANGRYILCETVAHFSQIVDILKELYPNLKLPHKCMDDQPFQPTYQISKDKARSLGIECIPLRETLKEAVDFLIEKKLITP
ncbi:phenylacetaldehyde reductase-like [Silene latifolia]|uniref:phenylacetaldehyde reductase-like n=1 Tax=Silene latifolia TaxID=37657 RepID=UPI003D780BD1